MSDTFKRKDYINNQNDYSIDKDYKSLYYKYKKKYLYLKDQIGSSNHNLKLNIPQLSDHPLCSYQDILFWNIEKEETYQRRDNPLSIEERNNRIVQEIISNLSGKNFVCLQEFKETNNQIIITRLNENGFSLINSTAKSRQVLEIPDNVRNEADIVLAKNYNNNDSGNAIFVRNNINVVENGGPEDLKTYDKNIPYHVSKVKIQRGLNQEEIIPDQEIEYFKKYESYFNYVIYRNKNRNNLLINHHGKKGEFNDLEKIIEFIIQNQNRNFLKIIIVGDFNKNYHQISNYFNNFNFTFRIYTFTRPPKAAIDHAISIRLN